MKNAFLRSLLFSWVAMVSMGLAVQVQAKPNPAVDPVNEPPPSGAILDLAGTAVPHTYQQYTVNFTASQGSTAISFALREDPAFLSLDDVSVVDVTHPSGNIIL